MAAIRSGHHNSRRVCCHQFSDLFFFPEERTMRIQTSVASELWEEVKCLQVQMKKWVKVKNPIPPMQVCLALQKFHKAQTSHQHATNAPPTHRRRISYVIKLKSGQRVGRQSVDTVGRRVDRRVGQHVGGIGFFTFTKKWNTVT